jgi:hypothetical protein
VSSAADDQPHPNTPDPDQAWKALSLVNDWVRHAETKVAATLAATGVTAGVLFAIWKEWQDASWLSVGLGYVAALVVLSAGWACAMGLLPRRTAKPEDDGFIDHLQFAFAWFCDKTGLKRVPPRDADEAPEDLVSLLFYSSIVKAYGKKGPEYREVLAALTADPHGMTAHVGQQVWANASVAERKFTWANRAIVRLVASWFLLGVLGYLRVAGL